jgi:putative ATPase
VAGTLFDESADRARAAAAPLAARLRPRTLDEFVGQSDVVGPGRWLRQAIDSDALSSVILYGPAGTGKTSLARIIAAATEAHFEEVSAVTGGVSELRAAIAAASDRLGLTGQRTILFIDEIHRFSKSQQDALLHAVEDRIIVLVGATTENPFFEVNAPLISRSRVIELSPLDDSDVRTIVERALTDERGFGGRVILTPDAEEAIVLSAGGDARVALTTLELAAQSGATRGASGDGAKATGAPGEPRAVTLTDVREASPTRILPYDKKGDVHYDVISAFIKSMRGSDPDAAIYWLARMIHGGEDPKFIARRMLIFASEDVGNADPRGLLVAHAAFKAAESIGWPECRINLAHAAVYLALAPKSNAACAAIDAALNDVRTGPARAVPNHLRDRHRPGSDSYGPYRYPHSSPDAYVEQRYLPEGREHGAFYSASPRGWEATQAAALEQFRRRAQAREAGTPSPPDTKDAG